MKPLKIEDSVLRDSVFVSANRNDITDPRVTDWIFERSSSKATGALGYQICNKAQCKIDLRRKYLELHWHVIFDMTNKDHVKLLIQWNVFFKKYRSDVPFFICLDHFDKATQKFFLNFGRLPEKFTIKTNTKSIPKPDSRRSKYKLQCIKVDNLFQPSLFVTLASHIEKAHAKFIKKGLTKNAKKDFIPFAPNPKLQKPNAKMNNPKPVVQGYVEIQSDSESEPTTAQLEVLDVEQPNYASEPETEEPEQVVTQPDIQFMALKSGEPDEDSMSLQNEDDPLEEFTFADVDDMETQETIFHEAMEFNTFDFDELQNATKQEVLSKFAKLAEENNKLIKKFNFYANTTITRDVNKKVLALIETNKIQRLEIQKLKAEKDHLCSYEHFLEQKIQFASREEMLHPTTSKASSTSTSTS
jgi:hypothetical protein